ncbi:DUF5131 family protein [Mangrovibrevibacter kandeliae]|uniref:DUF5131 family protein n=1 Tax=Mangrovibrevibacter kandeliae TaxID=2968473 RepID=UPI00211916D8|nr:DUF5131 family protein [Aurantimonas sp. CSK15Z-1]MCQ8781700.1 phage Gp37/Gp68 family protein [Aurantimonas sp. CSK15Z-1]
MLFDRTWAPTEATLSAPLCTRKSFRYGVCAHGDLFAEGVTDAMLDRIFAVMALCPQHTFQVLTKRPERMRDYLTDPRSIGRIARRILDLWIGGEKHARAAMAGDRWPVRSIGVVDDPDDVTVDLPLPNVWLGVSCEDQKRADERVPVLLDTPAAVRWVSAEPLLGPIDFRPYLWASADIGGTSFPMLDGPRPGEFIVPAERLHWIIVGGESGPGARPTNPEWVREIRSQCDDAGVPFLFKQWGEWLEVECARDTLGDDDPRISDAQCRPGGKARLTVLGDKIFVRVSKTAAGRLLDGVTHDGFPEVRRG